jgi:ABC-type branched-subunit amino acid transport system ATPase component
MLLEITELTKLFGGLAAVKDFDMHINKARSWG